MTVKKRETRVQEIAERLANSTKGFGGEIPAEIILDAVSGKTKPMPKCDMLFLCWVQDDIAFLLSEIDRLKTALRSAAQSIHDKCPRRCLSACRHAQEALGKDTA